MFWVPLSLREDICSPSSSWATSLANGTLLDLTDFVHGGEWTRCWKKLPDQFESSVVQSWNSYDGVGWVGSILTRPTGFNGTFGLLHCTTYPLIDLPGLHCHLLMGWKAMLNCVLYFIHSDEVDG
jgi:hypothetical protein